MPREHCLLDLILEWRDKKSYRLSGRFLDSKTDSENYLLEAVDVSIDTERLGKLKIGDDAEDYGTALTDMLFADAAVRGAYERARAAAVGRDGLRVRVNVLSSAPELHAVRWEALRDPTDRSRRLLTQDSLWFSRFLSSQELSLPALSDGRTLRCVVVVASPTDVTSKWQVCAIDRAAEFERARKAMSPEGGVVAGLIQPELLETRASVYNIVTGVRRRYADILFLVCHGKLIDGEARLLLEEDDGTGKLVRGEELVERLRDMTEKPRLIVLASCESAGDDDGPALAAVGPRLSMAGIPGVVAMQAAISVESATRFMSAFFHELAKDGQVDRAVAVGRGEIQDRPDWWVPLLLTRSRSGRLWPGVAGDGGFERWDALVAAIREGQCVPVLGPSLVTKLLGSTRDIAKRWAERYEFALAPRNRDDLAQVAQYLRYRQSRDLAITALRDYLVSHVREAFASQLAEIDRAEGTDLLKRPIRPGLLDELVKRVGAWQRQHDRHDVHRLLAKLPVPVFITANRDSLLRDALVEEGKSPQVNLCTWKVLADQPQRYGPTLPKGYEPSEQQPLVFQVFGSLEFPKSLVLTEDDYFDFLIAVTRNETLGESAVPKAVSSALAGSGLLLLGFQAEDWDFRALFRGIMRQPGAALTEELTRVAVQMSPSEGPTTDPDRASKYLTEYFQQNRNTFVFWGTPQEFMVKLARLLDLD